jgi:hypothetical protein
LSEQWNDASAFLPGVRNLPCEARDFILLGGQPGACRPQSLALGT